MKYIFLILAFLVLNTSCNKAPTYSSVCNDESKRKGGSVSGKEISTTKVKRNSYRNNTRRPHRLGLLRR